MNILRKRQNVDMTNGPILKSLILYAVPIAIINVMHLLFNATDVAVLGIFAGDDTVAAVGATTALITLITSIFNGLSSGVNVIVARHVGARDMIKSRRAVGTACVLGLLSGLILMVITLIGARTFLEWMKCDAAVIDNSVKYLRIYFLGMPILMLYNFIAASLRASGDSVRPMYFMLIAGVLNVLLNVFFIVVLHMTVDGVAVATVLSNAVALGLALSLLLKNDGYCKIERKNLRIFKEELIPIVKIGIPGGIGGIFFYMANVVIQTAVNTLGKDAMTANAVASQFDAFIYTVGAAFATACMAFVGQNLGAKKIDRIKGVIIKTIMTATVISLGLGVIFIMLSDVLCGIMTDNPAIVDIAKTRMYLLCSTYFTASIMEVFSFSLRALGWYKNTVAVGFLCGFIIRVFWVNVIWPLNPALWTLYMSYPVSNIIAIAIYLYVFAKAMKKLRKDFQEV